VPRTKGLRRARKEDSGIDGGSIVFGRDTAAIVDGILELNLGNTVEGLEAAAEDAGLCERSGILESLRGAGRTGVRTVTEGSWGLMLALERLELEYTDGSLGDCCWRTGVARDSLDVVIVS